MKKLKSSDYGDYSQIFSFDSKKKDFLFNEKDDLNSELGFSYITAKYAREFEELKSSFIKQKKELETNILKLKKQKKKTIFVEDSAHENIIKKLLAEYHTDITISKLGSCDKVLSTSKGVKDSFDNFYFLIDGDCKAHNDADLWHSNTLQLKKYCIENYLLTEETITHLLILKQEKISADEFIKNVINECKSGYSGFTVLSDIIDKYGLDWTAIDNVDASKIFEKIKNKLGYKSAIDVENFCFDILKNTNKLRTVFQEIIVFLGLNDAE